MALEKAGFMSRSLPQEVLDEERDGEAEDDDAEAHLPSLATTALYRSRQRCQYA